MRKRETKIGSRWERLRSFMKAHIGLTIIIVAALLVELSSGVMYYSAQNIIERTVTRLMERENNAIFLCIRNKLAEVEVTLDNMSWVVADDLVNPDSLARATYQLVEHNPAILGSSISCIPNLYPQIGYWYEPYSVRRSDGTIETMQLGSASHDYTKSEFYTVPVTTGQSHWSEPYLDSDGAKAIVTTYSVPVRGRNGKVKAVVDADISLDWLSDEVNQSKVYRSTQRFLLTGKHHLLAGENNQVFKKVLKVLEADEDKKGYEILKDEKGIKWHVFYTPVGGRTDWILVNCLNDSDVLGKLRRVRLNLLLMILIGIIPIGFIVYRTSRNLERLRKVNAEKDRISSELHVASQIQQTMLPNCHLKQDEVEIFGSLVPAREVGGDLYDYFIRDEKLFFCIGDVSGKGTPAAMMMAGASSFFRAFSKNENDPARIMKEINEAACMGNDTSMFVTLFIGVLDLPTGHLRYCNAGHDAPMVMTDGQWSMMDAKPHIPVGLFSDTKYNAQESYIHPNSTLFLYTDGLTEAKNIEHKQFRMERVEEALASCADKCPQELLETVTEAVHGFVGNAEPSDDLTMMAIHYSPQPFEAKLNETLTLKNDALEIAKLSTFLKSFFEKMTESTDHLDLGKSLVRELRLAIEEAVTNVIEYAYPAETEGDVEVTMLFDGHRLKVQIIDSGMPFDPTAKRRIDIPKTADELKIGGFGIHLVRELMDTINYERIDGQNVLTLKKKINEVKL